jgi:hypothetical protein
MKRNDDEITTSVYDYDMINIETLAADSLCHTCIHAPNCMRRDSLVACGVRNDVAMRVSGCSGHVHNDWKNPT